MPQQLPNGFFITTNEPVDARFIVDDIASRDSFESSNVYGGLITYVKETGLIYVLAETGSGDGNTLSESTGVVWKAITTPDSIIAQRAFTTMSIFNGTSTTFILSDSPSASLFISTSNQNLTITPNAGNDTITFGFSSTPTFTAVSASNALITNNLVVGGRVTAQEFHTEFISSSIIYESGSTQFGNSSDDTHIFTGSLKVNGSITGSLFGTASWAIYASYATNVDGGFY